MGKFRLIHGNFRQVVDKLGFPSVFYKPDPQEDYTDQVEKDLHRTSYVSYKDTVEHIQQSLRESPLAAEGGYFSYSQGGFDAGTFIPYIAPLATEAIENSDEEDREGMTGNLRVAYVDDAGVPCAVAINYLRKDPKGNEPPIPKEQRERLFSVTLIRNTTEIPSKREVFYISHPDLLAAKHAMNTEELDETALPGKLSDLLGSEKMKQLLAGLITADGKLSMPHFEELSKRISPDRNIDNRDVKLQQFNELIAIAKRHLPDHQIKDYFAQLQERAQEDVNFFKDELYEQTLADIEERAITEIRQRPSAPKENDRAVYELQLTLQAIRLELLADKLHSVEKDKAEYKCKGLSRQAAKLRAKRDDQPVMDEKAINYDELVRQGCEEYALIERYRDLLRKVEFHLAKYKDIYPDFYTQGLRLVDSIKAASIDLEALTIDELTLRDNLLESSEKLFSMPDDIAYDKVFNASDVQKFNSLVESSLQSLKLSEQPFSALDFNDIAAVVNFKRKIDGVTEKLHWIRTQPQLYGPEENGVYDKISILLTEVGTEMPSDPIRQANFNKVLLYCSEALSNPGSRKSIQLLTDIGDIGSETVSKEFSDALQELRKVDFKHIEAVVAYRKSLLEFKIVLEKLQRIPGATEPRMAFIRQGDVLREAIEAIAGKDGTEIKKLQTEEWIQLRTILSDCKDVISRLGENIASTNLNRLAGSVQPAIARKWPNINKVLEEMKHQQVVAEYEMPRRNFNVELQYLRKKPKSNEQEQAFCKQCEELSTTIGAIIGQNPGHLDTMQLSMLNRILSGSSALMDHLGELDSINQFYKLANEIPSNARGQLHNLKTILQNLGQINTAVGCQRMFAKFRDKLDDLRLTEGKTLGEQNFMKFGLTVVRPMLNTIVNSAQINSPTAPLHYLYNVLACYTDEGSTSEGSTSEGQHRLLELTQPVPETVLQHWPELGGQLQRFAHEDALLNYKENLKIFESKLREMKAVYTEGLNKVLYDQAVMVLARVKDVADNMPHRLSTNELVDLYRVLAHCTRTLGDPSNIKNHTELLELAQNLYQFPSKRLLAGSLLMLAGTGVILAACLAPIPVTGLLIAMLCVGIAAIFMGGKIAKNAIDYRVERAPERSLSQATMTFFQTAETLAKPPTPPKSEPEAPGSDAAPAGGDAGPTKS